MSKSDKDWTGNQVSLFKMLGASNHTDKEREANDFYATDPKAIDCLKEKIDLPIVILEPSCGAGHLSKRLEELGHKVYSYDKIDRGYGEVEDFFFRETMPDDCSCVLTNPPYKYATEFVLKSLELLPVGGLCCMFLKTTFLEGLNRWEKIYRNYPPSRCYNLHGGSRAPRMVNLGNLQALLPMPGLCGARDSKDCLQ